MAKKNTNVKETAEVKEEVMNVVDNSGNVEPVKNQVVSTEDSKVVTEAPKQNKLKAFLKKNWLWIVITLGVAAIVAVIFYIVGKKSGMLDEQDVVELQNQAIRDNWRRVNDILVNDPDQSYAIKVSDATSGHTDWLEINHVDTEPEWIQNGEGHLDF